MAVNKDFGVSFHLDKAFGQEPVRFRLFDLYQVGEICCEREYEIPLHIQPCDEISFILSGKGVFYIDDTPFPVRPGDVVLNKTGQTHFIRSDRSEKLRFAYLGYRFRQGDLGAAWNAVRDRLEAAQRQIVPDHEGMSLYFPRALREFYDLVLEDHMLFEVLVQEIFLLTYRDFVREQAEVPLLSARESPTEETVYHMMRYVESHLGTVSGTGEVAEQLGYSESYLSRLFRQKTGMTLQRYISELRIVYAIELMKLGEYSLSAIADLLHYQTPQAFSRAFRRTVGMSAREYANRSFKGYDPERLPRIRANAPSSNEVRQNLILGGDDDIVRKNGRSGDESGDDPRKNVKQS